MHAGRALAAQLRPHCRARRLACARRRRLTVRRRPTVRYCCDLRFEKESLRTCRVRGRDGARISMGLGGGAGGFGGRHVGFEAKSLRTRVPATDSRLGGVSPSASPSGLGFLERPKESTRCKPDTWGNLGGGGRAQVKGKMEGTRVRARRRARRGARRRARRGVRRRPRRRPRVSARSARGGRLARACHLRLPVVSRVVLLAPREAELPAEPRAASGGRHGSYGFHK